MVDNFNRPLVILTLCVFYCSPNISPPEIGATQVRLASITRELLRLGHQVEIVTAVPNYPEGKIVPNYQGHFYLLESWEGIPLHRVWIYVATGAGGKRLLNYFSFMLTALWGLRQTQRPDYIVVEPPPLFLGITAYLAAKRWQVPWILNIADLWSDSVRALGLLKFDRSRRMAVGVRNLFRSRSHAERGNEQMVNRGIGVVTTIIRHSANLTGFAEWPLEYGIYSV